MTAQSNLAGAVHHRHTAVEKQFQNEFAGTSRGLPQGPPCSVEDERQMTHHRPPGSGKVGWRELAHVGDFAHSRKVPSRCGHLATC